ncbi:MAG: NUDIX domain-containing protein [Heyndrickxia sp.]
MENVEIPIRTSGIAVVLLKKFDDEYKVLLLKRTSSVLNEAWCYIGGKIEKGEKAWEAAVREVEEETGMTDISYYVSNRFDQFYDPKVDYIYLAPVFVGFVNHGQDIKLNEEHSEYKWLTFKEALEKVTLPGNDEVLTFIEKHFVKRKPTELLRIEK